MCSHRDAASPLGPILAKYEPSPSPGFRLGLCAHTLSFALSFARPALCPGCRDSAPAALFCSHRFMTERHTKWLETVTHLASHHDDVVARRDARLHTFSRALFKHEMEVTMSFLVRPVRALYHFAAAAAAAAGVVCGVVCVWCVCGVWCGVCDVCGVGGSGRELHG